MELDGGTEGGRKEINWMEGVYLDGGNVAQWGECRRMAGVE
jgi:hypothetical protein